MGDWYEKLSRSFKDTVNETLAKADTAPNIKCFTRRQIKRISNNYSTILGKGGFSVVYKGILDNGRPVAVKQYNWKTQKKEFTKEVIIQSQCSHKNIVRLLGCCVEADAPMLVTEFVPNGNLSELLHNNNGMYPVSLETRLQIALDVAEALVYMHSSQNHPILHGDIKPSNILLGNKDVAKLCDFGISRLLCMDSDEYTEFIIGSKGYVDPVFCQTGRLSPKCDVYSFGVVLLELITKKKGIDDMKVCLAEVFTRASRKGDGHELFDMDIVTHENMEFLEGVGRLALECIKFEVEARPEMKEVLNCLWNLKRSRDSKIHEMQIVRREIEVLWIRCGFGRFIIRKERVDDMTRNLRTVTKECKLGKAYVGKFCNTPLMAIKMSTAATEKWKNILWNELNIQSRINHWNVTKLLGCCLDHPDGPVLLYEYGLMSLYDVLFRDASQKSLFRCNLRLKIAIGAALGLAHLHSLGMVHGNVSIDNIMMDDLSVLRMISDSSTSVKFAGYRASGLIDMDNQYAGLFAEDWLKTADGEKKDDVYYFGLVLLTLFTWKKVSPQEADTVFEQLWDIEPPHDVNSEPEKPGPQHKESIGRCPHREEVKSLASRCLASQVTQRPSMVEVTECLKNTYYKLHDGNACHELAIYQSRNAFGLG